MLNVFICVVLLQDWRTNPFKLTARDGYMYGRGTSDNKGPILAMIFAVRELLDRKEGEECGGLPVNIGFVFEGEEEIGSMGLADVVQVRSLPVLPFQPKYRLGHPEIFLFLLSKKVLTGSKYPKNRLFSFEKNFTAR